MSTSKLKKHKFKLYIVENTRASNELIVKLRLVFENALKENYTLEVIDILKHPDLALKDKILATPTLILEAPLPQKRIVGNLGNKESVLIALNLMS